MIGSNALSVVAAMQYVKIIWNRSVRQRPGISMSGATWLSEPTVSVGTHSPLPVPAVRPFFDLAPEEQRAFGCKANWCCENWHNRNLNASRWSGRCQTRSAEGPAGRLRTGSLEMVQTHLRHVALQRGLP